MKKENLEEDKSDKTEMLEIKEETPKELPQEENKQNKKHIIFMTICAAVLVAFIVVGIASITTYDKKMNKNTTKIKKDKTETASAYRLSGNSLEDFDLYFLQLENKKTNVVYSPLSIKYALAMLNEGTDGASHEQIANIIGDYQAKRYDNNNHMSFANAMFIRNTYQKNIKEDYVSKIQKDYGAEVILDTFENASVPNAWVSKKTFNLINNLLKDENVQQENFILINALAIDMNWVNRIQSATGPLPEGMSQKYYWVFYTHENYSDRIETIEDERYPSMTFNQEENTKSVKVGASFNHYDIVNDLGEDKIRETVTNDFKKYLAENPDQVQMCPSVEEYVNKYVEEIDKNYKKEDVSTDFSIYVDDEVKVFAKDLQTYDGTTLQYVGIMPKNTDLTTYINKLNAKDLTKLINKLKEAKYDSFKEGVVTQIKGNIPLFKYEYQLDLINDLQKLGIEDIFDINKSDLSKMIKGKQVIDDATHKAMIEFSNDGIKAAAATSMSGAGAAVACDYDYLFDIPVETIDITFDQPYLYIIRDKNTGEVWFTGTVYSAEKN